MKKWLCHLWEVKKCLLDPQEDVKRRLCEITQQTKQSIDQHSIELNCSSLAGIWCTSRKGKRIMTKWDERQPKNRVNSSRSIRRAVGGGRNVAHRFAPFVRCWQRQCCHVGLRLHELFTPVEKGHFVVTFAEWCHCLLNQVQQEITDSTVKWMLLQDLNLGIYLIAVSDKDGHIFVYAHDKEFVVSGKVVSWRPLREGVRRDILSLEHLLSFQRHFGSLSEKAKINAEENEKNFHFWMGF